MTQPLSGEERKEEGMASRDHAPTTGIALEPETAWLLESTTPWPGGATHWFALLEEPYRTPRSRRYHWYTYTDDPNKALRFESKEAAERYRDHRGLELGHRCDLIATEHEWPAPSSAKQVDGESSRDALNPLLSGEETAKLVEELEVLWRDGTFEWSSLNIRRLAHKAAALLTTQASEIERLRGERDDLRRSFANRNALLPEDPFPLWMQVVASFDQEVRRAHFAEATVASQAVRIAELEKALEPFAEAADRIPADPSSAWWPTMKWITLDHLRRARTTLAVQKGEGG